MTSSVRRDLVLLLSENQPRSPGNPKHLNLLELRWLKNWCFSTVVLEKTLESPLDCKEIQSVHPKGDQSWVFNWKDWCWSWNSNTLATWCEELTHLKRPWCWERLRAGGEGDDRGWDGWMASPTRWTWVWVDSESWWWTGRTGVLWFMELQRVSRTRLNWIEMVQSWASVPISTVNYFQFITALIFSSPFS